MSTEPFVSIIVCVRNGMPYLQEAMDSLLALDYTNFEVVIQDGASTDGTLAYLQSFADRPNWSVVSAPDSGIGQGFNRALQRCRGEIVCSLDADNRFRSNALRLAVDGFRRHPEAAVVYGTCGMIDADGGFVQTWVPPRFDVLALVDGTVVPPFASSFFHRPNCGEELRFDESMSIVPDFDLWLRLSPKPILVLDSEEPLVDVRIGEMSSTWTPDTYERQCALKVDALKRYLDGPAGDGLVRAWFRQCAAGLYLWGVESLANIGAGQERVDAYFRKTHATNARADRFRWILTKAVPVMSRDDAEFADRLLALGRELIRHGRYDEALPYIELLYRSSVRVQEVKALVEECRGRSMQARLQLAQEEVNRRDALLVERESDCRAQMERRDRLLRTTVEAMQKDLNLRDEKLQELQQQVLDEAQVRVRLQDEINRRDDLLAEARAQYDATVDAWLRRRAAQVRRLLRGR